MGACLLLVIGTAFSPGVYAGQGVWTSGGPYGGEVLALAIDPVHSGTLYAGTQGGGVFKSTNAGGSWAPINAGLPSATVRALAIDPSMPATLYAGTEGSGVFKSVDGGLSWRAVNSGLTANYVSALAIDPSAPTTLYAAAAGGVFKTTNGGEGWTFTFRNPNSADVVALTIDASVPSHIYAGAEEVDWPPHGGLFRSTDSGASWSDSLLNLDVYALVIDPSSPTTLYAATYDGVYKSSNGGETWPTPSATLTSLIVPALAIDPSNPSTLYAGTSGGVVFRSIDSGSTWTTITNGLPELSVFTLALDPTGSTLYAGLLGGGVWQLTAPKAGTTWTALLPASAHSSGANGSFYTTNVAVANVGSAPASFTMKFLGHDQDGSAGPEQTFNLESGRSVTYFDVLGTVFGQISSFGAIRITSDSPALDIVSVTSTPGFDGTLSQTIPAVFSSDLIPAGSSRSILYIRQGDGFRSNLVLASNADIPTTVDVSLISPEGVTLATKAYSVPPKGMTQIGRVVRDMGVPGAITGARLVLSSSTPGAAFTAFVSVIDEVTNDPTTVEAR
jgi:photosystem II stability/assembly factor-like uncharacterized protein